MIVRTVVLRNGLFDATALVVPVLGVVGMRVLAGLDERQSNGLSTIPDSWCEC